MIFLLLISIPLAALPPGGLLTPRSPAEKHRQASVPPKTLIESIVVKFHEGTQVRLRGQSLAMLAQGPREKARLASLGLTAGQVQDDLRAIQALLAVHKEARGIERLFTAGEEELAASRARGEARAGRELADLGLYFRVPVPSGTTQAEVESLVSALNAMASVEIAYAQTPAVPPVDIPPITPNFEPSQDYLEAAPLGIDAYNAWTFPGGRGQGVRIVDVEGAWNTAHEDLPPLFHQGGVQTTDPSWLPHGTAVLGEMVGVNNGYGVTGIAHQAQAGYESFASQGVASAVTNAATAAGAGGVVLVEVQYHGPATPNSACGCSGSCCDCVPVEINQAEFDAIAQATTNGTVVVEAAANGATDLDDPVYLGVFNRLQRDSGAVLVGASNSTDRAPTCFTNFGSRVDVHGWGWDVTTTGYGDLFNGGGDPNQNYTASFSGTSSASPIVTGAAAVLQGISLANGRGFLTPAAMRQLLRGTGTPQATDTRQIGPLPNLRTAAAQLLLRQNPDTPGIFRNGTFFLRNQNSSGTADLSFAFGISGDRPVAGDWNGDGIDTIGVFRNGTFFLRNSNSSGFGDVTVAFGAAGDQPIVGDWNGDGIDTVGFYRNGGVYLRNSNSSGSPEIVFSFGVAGDVAIAGDWDGNGTDTIGLFRPSNGTMYLKNSNSGAAADVVLTFGTTGDQPVAGDWNGDGVDTVGVYRNGTFYLRNTNTSGTADLVIGFGLAGDLPIVGDWNGLP
jgi:serine protease